MATLGSVRQSEMMLIHEHSTMLVSDANSKSVSFCSKLHFCRTSIYLFQSTSNPYTSVHRPRRRKKRLSRHHTLQKPHLSVADVAESDSDCVPSSKTESSNQIDLSHWDPSPKKQRGGAIVKDVARVPTPSN